MKKSVIAFTASFFIGLFSSLPSFSLQSAATKSFRTLGAGEALSELNSIFNSVSLLRLENLQVKSLNRGHFEVKLLASNLVDYMARGAVEMYYDTLQSGRHLEFFKADLAGAGKDSSLFFSNDLCFSKGSNDLPLFFVSIVDSFPYLKANKGDSIYFWSKKYVEAGGANGSGQDFASIETLRFSSPLEDLPPAFQDLVFLREAEISMFLNSRFEF